MKMKHILIVEDVENVLRFMCFYLLVDKYQVSTASNGKEALEKIIESARASNPVDLLVLDLKLPKLSGTELIDTLNNLNIDIPTVVVSAYGKDQIRQVLHGKKHELSLTKPFEPEELKKAIKKILQNKTLLEV